MKIEELFGGYDVVRNMNNNEEFMDKVIYKMIALHELYDDDELFERDYARLCFIRFGMLNNPNRFKLFQVASYIANDGVDDMYHHVCWKFQDLVEIFNDTEDDLDEDIIGLDVEENEDEIKKIWHK